MKAAYVFPLGYDVSGIEMILGGLSGEGTVLLLLPKELDYRAKASLDSLKAFVSGMNARGSSLDVRELYLSLKPEKDIPALILELTKYENRNFYATGGMRYFSLLLYYAASFFRTDVKVIIEDDSSVVSFPAVPFKGLKPIHLRILKNLAYSPRSVKRLSAELGRSRSTVERALKDLVMMKAVAKDGKGFAITELGTALSNGDALGEDA